MTKVEFNSNGKEVGSLLVPHQEAMDILQMVKSVDDFLCNEISYSYAESYATVAMNKVDLHVLTIIVHEVKDN
ncbi:hypothetical protein [Anaerospora hongkongensis]|uniref:hypothetical protein n=1 Tax=Anaerospora hongkongensis TaxID=244830 RepID=UPI002FDB86BD